MSYITTSISDKVATITFSRADKLNSFIREMAFELQSALDQLAVNEAVRCIVITGEGRAFCAGQDLIEATDPDGPSLSSIVSEHYNPVIIRIRNIPKPVIAAVNGVAAGAGANIALACDIVVASESASFIQIFSKIGLIPDSGGTYMLPRLIGMQRATALMMLGDKVNAIKAREMGMIYEVYKDESFSEEVRKLALQLAEMPTYGLALTKQALNQSYMNNLVQQLSLEDELQTLAGNSADYKEGTSAFLEKRKPLFKGR
ncbi:MAG TPA: 2-(1,2-epoxy-1,2-dihydrophenyl)acetyl-CoA isomerase PaaG [Saprospiraceae bacterium]|jgi:2-(1,2-epoxy-1,2-dihydrophenyl)acetyl-CoA isomerase|nr:2-(1,2-epoxy-1,2-dihydrophenyl)acetyl-CoA isomerase [Saprospiraceae bacterium]HRO07436.1 2-(1,2-epoxy-1,2-dihydrophenyl)acetyl-CoA isomerase PaaG [Saprospiraceae bacterium]HRP40719.1 2-(1,2-epoxy-1,2-dihydrophenyl)acetyl-CoA isomerase PaaG [Saprospiraceae bacterium]